MEKKQKAGPIALERPVWFFLLSVRVTGHTKQPRTAGSEAMVQAFVPGKNLERSLAVLDAYLLTEELERIDTVRAIRYDPNDDDADLPGDFFRKPLERAAATNECVLGAFFVSDDTATRRRDVH
jgi:hypothetical protein